MSDHPTQQKIIHPPAFVVDAETLRAVVREAVGDVLLRVGVNTEEAEELRKDMAHLRQWRMTMDKVRDESLAAAVKYVVIGIFSAIIFTLSVKLGILKIPGL